ncbi:MAG TPA: hypothetical protein VHW64_13570 [Nocardioides sp.]|uniref:hypothetical protein n=1 Tax=Nocardioides sp. TaxID=35761 RepID=UPI002E3784A6|nr:hypothetical protein [Nocardioides sp.]HEX3931729.1 hypothetical protein [Nocardioides sp.]
MAHSTARRLVALAGGGAMALMLQVPAHGANPDFTKITSPTNGATFLDRGGSPTFQLAGRTSVGVSFVDLYCFSGPQGNVTATPVATNVTVTNKAFSTTVPVPDAGGASPVCRLRAIPFHDPVEGDVSMFSGPVLHLDRVERLTQGSSTFDFDLAGGSGTGSFEVHSAASCGDAAMGTVADNLAVRSELGGCVANLGASDVAGSPLRVDGHTALLPYATLSLASSTSLRLHIHAARSGRVTWTESAPLVRCSGSDAFPPPSAGQCGSVVATGVTFTRSGTFTANGQQVRLQDSFASTDGRQHRVRTTYSMGFVAPPTGGLGFAFPGRGAGFHGSTKGQPVTGLPKRAGTVLVRSDRFAVEGDPQASTRAVTWSRPPTHVAFSTTDASLFGASYSLKVHKHGSATLGFTDSLGERTSTAKRLGRAAVSSVMSFPRITSPKKGAVVDGRKTVVKGILRAGVNGLPASVRVEGQPATITASGASRATFKVVLHEPPGKHTLTAVATDAGGNKRSTSVTVRNK